MSKRPKIFGSQSDSGNGNTDFNVDGQEYEADTWLFDSENISPEQRAVVRSATNTIRTSMEDIVGNVFEIGRQLTLVKKILGHGTWLRWITEVGFEERTAQRMINIYERLGTKADLFRMIKVTALYQLSMPSTPDEVIEKVEQRLSEGEYVTARQVSAIIATYRRSASLKRENTELRLVQVLRKAYTILDEQTLIDCEERLGDEAVHRLKKVRKELDRLLKEVKAHEIAIDLQTESTWTELSSSTQLVPIETPGQAESLIELRNGDEN